MLWLLIVFYIDKLIVYLHKADWYEYEFKNSLDDFATCWKEFEFNFRDCIWSNKVYRLLLKKWDRDIDDWKLVKSFFYLFLFKFDILIHAKYVLIWSKLIRSLENNSYFNYRLKDIFFFRRFFLRLLFVKPFILRLFSFLTIFFILNSG